MKNTKCLVTVYLPTHNRVGYLRRAVKSVLGQSFEDFELVICDDGSVDETHEYLKALCKTDCRVKVVRNEVAMGACASRNRAISVAKGEFITGLDDDDEFLPDRLKVFLENWNEGRAFLCANSFVNGPSGGSRLYYRSSRRDFSYRDLLLQNEASNQVFTRTKRMIDIGGFVDGVQRYQDWDTWIRLAYRFGRFYRIPVPLYILHDDHVEGAERVSTNLPTAEALRLLMVRNRDLYESQDAKAMERQIGYYQTGKYSAGSKFRDLLYYAARRWLP